MLSLGESIVSPLAYCRWGVGRSGQFLNGNLPQPDPAVIFVTRLLFYGNLLQPDPAVVFVARSSCRPGGVLLKTDLLWHGPGLTISILAFFAFSFRYFLLLALLFFDPTSQRILRQFLDNFLESIKRIRHPVRTI
jgi:hypothetical protein